jgi:hypothetical protein
MMGSGGARVVFLAAFVLVTALVHPAVAPAKHGLVTGFADGLYTSAVPAERATWLDRTVESKAGIVRINLLWARVAGPVRPTDPSNPASTSYDFSSIDAGVRDAEARGLRVMVTLSDVPAWAEGAGRPSSAPTLHNWKPSPSDVADFAQAVAARYSGGFDPDGPGPASPLPAVQALQVWNEPNLSGYLAPQYEGETAFSPGYYREMLNAAYAAVKAVDPRMLVVTAGTAPYGDPPGGNRVRPVDFWRQVLCASPGKKKRKHKKKRKRRAAKSGGCQANFDVLAHHPINTSGGPRQHAINPRDASSADLDRVARVLRAAERAGTVLPGRHPLWATEMWWDSNPPNSAGFPLGRQARWIEDALYQAWKDGASVVVNLEIRDSPSGPHDALAGADSGIFFADGRPKPSYTAFSFPFVADRNSRRVIRAWGKAPAGGKLVIQRKRGKRWVATKKLRVRPGQVFLTRLRITGRPRLRAVVAGNRSLTWTPQ